MDIYLILVLFLVVLAISDLVVGVSNDAVNFLNSAIGARVAKLKVIMIVAGAGVLVGALMSGGMMEVARKGIFNPQFFQFQEIMFIFMAVMITDVILLDMFNSFGMPTSTTVSIVFELLGAAVGMAAIKVWTENLAPGTAQLTDYINTATALKIIGGILLSVVVAFSVGMIIQFLTRLLFSFDFKRKVKYYGGLWGGFALTAIFYFILIKGAKNAPFMSGDVKEFIKGNTLLILGSSFLFWAILLQAINAFTKINIFKVIVLAGTFALAMAFAGNDLVNFIGVPIASYESYQLFMSNGGDTTDFLMTGLSKKEEAPVLFLVLAGMVMVITLWLSKKARNTAKRVTNFMPAGMKNRLELQFDQRPFNEMVNASAEGEAPAFDLVRAAVTLVVASILIAIGTTLKLPLSTTYVTFMVAMGTSLADGAWGRESAVYRVSGVLSVIGGWFFTAFSAFSAAFIIVILFYNFGLLAVAAMLVLVVFLLYKSHVKQKKMDAIELDDFELGNENSVDGAYVYAKGVKYSNRLFQAVNDSLAISFEALEKDNVRKLLSSKRDFKIVFDKIKRVNNKVNTTIERLDDASEDAGINYIKSVYFLHEVAHSNDRIIRPIYEYSANSHKPLLADQFADLNKARLLVEQTNNEALQIINSNDYGKLEEFLTGRDERLKEIDALRKIQLKRIKNKEVGTRNSVLFLDTLSEIRHLMVYAGNFIYSFYEFDETVKNGNNLTSDTEPFVKE